MSKTIIEKSLDLVNNLQTVKTNLITAISNKGVEVPTSTRLAELSGYIENIETDSVVEFVPVEFYPTDTPESMGNIWYTDVDVSFDVAARFPCTASSTFNIDGINYAIAYSPVRDRKSVV